MAESVFFLATLQKLLSCALSFSKIWLISYMDKDPKAFDCSQNRNITKKRMSYTNLSKWINVL